MTDKVFTKISEINDNHHFRRYAREWAMQFMFQYDIEKPKDIKSAIEKFVKELQVLDFFENTDNPSFKRAEKAAIQIIEGILFNRQFIDEIITQYSLEWSLSRMDSVDKNIMRVAVYEMFNCDNIPPIVSINEAIEISKKYASGHSFSFINGILNSIKNTIQRPHR